MKKFLCIVLVVVLTMAMTVTGYADSNVIETHIIATGESKVAEDENGNMAIPGIRPRMSSNGDFTILFQANQKVPLYVDSDRFTLEDTSCEIFMDITNLLPDEPLSHENIKLTLYGKGCGFFGKSASYPVGKGNYVFEFTELKKGEKYYFEVELYDWVSIDGNMTNVDTVYKK